MWKKISKYYPYPAATTTTATTATPNVPEIIPLFGIPLKEAAIRTDSICGLIPSPIRNAITYLNAKGLDQEGLYRIPGSHSKYLEYKDAYDKGEDVDYIKREELVQENVAMMLVKYLKALPSGDLFGSKSEDFHAACRSIIEAKESLESLYVLQKLFDGLPPENKESLIMIADHLRLVISYSSVNKMSLDAMTMTFIISLGENLGHMLKFMIKHPDIFCKSRTIYGETLEIAAKRSPGGFIPYPLYACIHHLEKNHPLPEDLYIAGSNIHDVVAWRYRLNALSTETDTVDFPDKMDPNTAATLIRLYIRHLPTSLFSEDESKSIEAVGLITDGKERVVALQNIIQSFSEIQYATVSVLFCHFHGLFKSRSGFNLKAWVDAVFHVQYINIFPLMIASADELFPKEHQELEDIRLQYGRSSTSTSSSSGGSGGAPWSRDFERSNDGKMVFVDSDIWDAMKDRIKELEEENAELKRELILGASKKK